MKLGKDNTGFMILTAILWVIITILGAKGNWYPALVINIMLMAIYMMLGCAKKGVLNKKIFIYPILAFVVLWEVGFYLAKYYGDMFAGKMPDFTIMGYHPSFFYVVLFYWIGGVLTLSIGYIALKDLWLSESDWDNFKKKLEDIRKNEKKVQEINSNVSIKGEI